MKITILQGAFLPVPALLGGAVEKMWFALGKDFARKGHEVIHISKQHDQLSNVESIENVSHIRVEGFSTPASGILLKCFDFIYTVRAIKIIPRDSDVIVTNTFWAPILLPRCLKRKCMVDVQRMPKGQMKLYQRASRLRANSNAVAEAILKELSKAPQKQIVVIPNPLPFENLPLLSMETKERIILYVGRIHPEKGLELLINAFTRFNIEWKLVIAGPSDVQAGGGGSQYLDSLKRLAVDKNIEFSGPIYDANKLNELYRKSSLFVYPSVAEQGETFGLAPLEAMAWGCVPIVSGLACFRDFINNGINGLVFDHRSSEAINLLRDAMEALKKDRLYRLGLAREAIKVQNSHSTSRIANLFLEEFESIRTGLK